MKYKGYNIGKTSAYVFSGGRLPEGFIWNVNKDGKNVKFDTLREAKEWINQKVRTLHNTNQNPILGSSNKQKHLTTKI